VGGTSVGAGASVGGGGSTSSAVGVAAGAQADKTSVRAISKVKIESEYFRILVSSSREPQLSSCYSGAIIKIFKRIYFQITSLPIPRIPDQ
jgi:hypothetical protein